MQNKEPSAIKKMLGDFSPKLVQLTDDVLFGDVWERPELSKRDRSLIVPDRVPDPLCLVDRGGHIHILAVAQP